MWVHEPEVVEFYINLMVLVNNVVSSRVKGLELVFDKVKLGRYGIFH